MTTHNLRNIPHPVLSPISQDYQESCSFRAPVRNIRRSEDNTRIIIAIEYLLEEPALREMIESGDAQYITLTRCPATRVRDAHPCREERQEIVLEAARYRGEIRIESLLTATRPISGFHSPQWTQELREFIPRGADVPAAAILAFAASTRSRDEDQEPMESCVTIIPSEDTPGGQFDVSLDDEHITISINPGDMLSLGRMRGSEHTQSSLWPSIYLAAIERAVREHLNEDHREKQWAGVIAGRLRENEIDASDPDILRARSLSIAQKIMEQPLRRIMEEESAKLIEENE